MAQAGWYPDPSDAANLRWWDGERWTEHVTAARPQDAPVEVERDADADKPAEAGDPTETAASVDSDEVPGGASASDRPMEESASRPQQAQSRPEQSRPAPQFPEYPFAQQGQAGRFGYQQQAPQSGYQPQQPGYQPNYQGYQYQQPAPNLMPGAIYPMTDTDRTLRLIAFILNVLCTVAIGWLIVPLAWMVPMTVHSWGIYKGTKANTVAFGVCTLIFLSMISGVLLLVSTKER